MASATSGPSDFDPPHDPSAVDPDVEAVLRDPAALWEAVQRTSGEYIAVVDREGIIRGCNRVDDGFAVEEVIGHSFMRFTEPESTAALTAALHDVLTTGEPRSLETTVRQIDGGLSYFALRIAPIRRDGRVVVRSGDPTRAPRATLDRAACRQALRVLRFRRRFARRS